MIEPSKYNLDLTGEAPANHIPGEEHQIPQTGGNRAVVLRYGAYYTRSLVVKDVVSGRILTRGVDYMPACLIPSPTAQSGKEVCGYLVVTNQDVSETISVDYHLVGGFYVFCAYVINDLLKTLDNDDRKVSYNAIKNKPAGMPTGLHFHDLGDVYGFGFVVYALEKIRLAVIDADDPAWTQLLAYLQNTRLAIETGQDLLRQALAAHVAQKNPHQLTAAQADAATPADVEATRTMITTEINTRVAEVTSLITSLLASANAHISDTTTGAHNVTIQNIGGVSESDVTTSFNNARNSINNVFSVIGSTLMGRVAGQREHTNGRLYGKWYNNFVAGVGTTNEQSVLAGSIALIQLDDAAAKSFYMFHNQATRAFNLVLSSDIVLTVSAGERIAKVSDAQAMIGSMLQV